MSFTIREIDRHGLKRFRQTLVRFIRKYGERRITRSAIQWLKTVRGSALAEEGNLILAALEGRKLVGLVAAADYGRRESFIVVHPAYRRQGIALELVNELVRRLDRVYGRVALDNIPSLAMCLQAGFVAFALDKGPTGKPTLWLGKGDWRKEEVLPDSFLRRAD